MFAACPWLPTRVNAVGSPPRLYQETDQIWSLKLYSSQNSLVRLSHEEVPFAALLSSLPHPGDCVHSHPGEQASETPSVEILHRETGDKVFGERLGATAAVRALLRRFDCFIDRSDDTMGDISHSHGGDAGATFPVAMYVLFLPYLALLLVPFSDLMHVLSLMCVVKYACAYVMLLSKNAHKSKGKNKGVSQTTNFKKKGKTEKKDPYWACGETGHWANRCPQRKGKKGQAGQNSNSVNMVIGNTGEGTTGFLVVKSGLDDMNVGTIFESRDATFFEDIFPMRDMHGMSSWESDPIHETSMESDEESDDESSDSDEDDNEAPTRSKRQRIAKSFGNDFIVYLVDDTPTTISEALASPDADH
ncbi:hypothetical protein QYE76_012294 [Lolium multiflorum]|uniref:CCHC-type domain-containing protein n=1 Tax=Lolium multiflorum TaxID=4521 RepID=A0AAD8X659_LOLMU|nr:hypothetical protein QYE76_012294 [Lolium multiflorum]